MIRRALALLLLATLTTLPGCAFRRHRPVAVSAPHYVVGAPYQAGGIWRYPREQFAFDQTGLAATTTRGSGLTADGEFADPGALAAAAPSLQLPAIARVTNLDTGLQVLVRVNDRGPEQPGRLIALTPRAAQLLGGAGQPALRVRVEVMEAESRQLAAELNGADAPLIQVAAAPTTAIASETLPPPPGARQAPQVRAGQSAPVAPQVVAPSGPPIPLRLPEQVFQVPPRPGPLYVEAGTFGQLQYAEIMRRRLATLGAQTSTSYNAPRDRAYRVRIGPLESVAEADAALANTIAAGITDARIVAE